MNALYRFKYIEEDEGKKFCCTNHRVFRYVFRLRFPCQDCQVDVMSECFHMTRSFTQQTETIMLQELNVPLKQMEMLYDLYKFLQLPTLHGGSDTDYVARREHTMNALWRCIMAGGAGLGALQCPKIRCPKNAPEDTRERMELYRAKIKTFWELLWFEGNGEEKARVVTRYKVAKDSVTPAPLLPWTTRRVRAGEEEVGTESAQGSDLAQGHRVENSGCTAAC